MGVATAFYERWGLPVGCQRCFIKPINYTYIVLRCYKMFETVWECLGAPLCRRSSLQHWKYESAEYRMEETWIDLQTRTKETMVVCAAAQKLTIWKHHTWNWQNVLRTPKRLPQSIGICFPRRRFPHVC